MSRTPRNLRPPPRPATPLATLERWPVQLRVMFFEGPRDPQAQILSRTIETASRIAGTTTWRPAARWSEGLGEGKTVTIACHVLARDAEDALETAERTLGVCIESLILGGHVEAPILGSVVMGSPPLDRAATPGHTEPRS
jgi:hypothetical protein